MKTSLYPLNQLIISLLKAQKGAFRCPEDALSNSLFC